MGAQIIEQTFGELRSVLAGAPSEAGWERVCALCEAAAGEDEERFEGELLPYVLEGLRGWPDGERRAPQRWIEVFTARGAHPCAPLVRRLDRKPERNKNMAALLSAPGLSSVTALDLGALGITKLQDLAPASMLGALRELELGSARVTPASARLFERMPALRRLMSSYGDERDAILDGLEGARLMPTLEALWMAGMGMEAQHMSRLRGCGALRELALWVSEELGDEGVAALCEALVGAPLELLNLGGCGVGEEGIRRLGQAPWRLQTLMVWDNALSEGAVALLAEAAPFVSLRTLNMNQTGLYGAALAPLLGRRGPSALRELWCEAMPGLEVESWQAAARGDVARGLEVLRVEDDALGADGKLEALVAGLDGGHLATLRLAKNELEARHMRAMAEADLGALRLLDLKDNRIGDEGLERLLEAAWIGGLEALNLEGCGVSGRAFELLERRADKLGALRSLYLEPEEWTGRTLERLGAILPQVTLRRFS